MKKNHKRLLTLAIMMATTAPVFAATMNEIEANDPVASAQYLSIQDKETDINAYIGTAGSATNLPTTDLDYFTFYAKAGDVVTLDIDGGIGGVKSVDTIIAVFDSNYKILRFNDDASSVDAGSVSPRDSRIDDFKVPADGIYHVGVSAYPRFFSNGGDVTRSGYGSGDYKLVISGVSPAAQQINIDIKPGSDAVAPINPKSKGKVPVALLSDAKFNALTVDTATLTFGAEGNENSLSKCNTSGEDVNGDGLLDLVCHFDNQAAGFKVGDLEGVVIGKTKSGLAFEGRGYLKVVPALTK